jgi:hypothetical protein
VSIVIGIIEKISQSKNICLFAKNNYFISGECGFEAGYINT